MSYHTASLPDPIRQQVEDFIEFLLWKHQQQTEHTAPKPDPKAFLQQWTGYFAGVDPEQAKDEYLTDKYQ